jgi:hypothetical protein
VKPTDAKSAGTKPVKPAAAVKSKVPARKARR